MGTVDRMAEADRYRTLARAMTECIAGVPDDKWSAATPCEGWTARDVVQHLVDTSGMFLGFIDQEAPAGPSVDDDPLGAFSAARDAVQGALDDPATASKEYDGMFGRTSSPQSTPAQPSSQTQPASVHVPWPPQFSGQSSVQYSSPSSSLSHMSPMWSRSRSA
jgi:uncharacterized protein (TIGR03083 family)